MMPFVNIGSLSIPSFFIVISFSLSFLILYLSFRLENFKFPYKREAYDVALVLMIFGFMGGRLMHVFYEEWPFYQKHPWQIFYFWQGGFVFYGGFAFSFLGASVYCRLKKINFLEMADFFSPLLSLSHAFGRLGCFLAGCCYGTKCDLPWALDGRHPTTLYLFCGEVLIYIYLLFFETQIKRLNRIDLSGAVFAKWVLLHSLLRLIVEYYRDDFRGAFFELPLFGQLSVSQLISLLVAILSLIYFILKIKKPAKP